MPPILFSDPADRWVTDRWLCKIKQLTYNTPEEVCCCSTRVHVRTLFTGGGEADSVRYCPGTLSFPSSFQPMSRTTSLGMGYLHSDMNRRLTSAGTRHIVTRLAARSVVGHALRMQVHQHYGFELNLVLGGRSCLRRDCSTNSSMRRVCTQFGLCHPFCSLTLPIVG
jgi:hypothetical protein